MKSNDINDVTGYGEASGAVGFQGRRNKKNKKFATGLRATVDWDESHAD